MMKKNAKTILIVDDEPFTLKVTQFRLNQAGYNVKTAESGYKTLQTLEYLTPDLILLDLGLPDIDGTQVAHEIKNDPRWSSIPVILFTASTDRIKSVVKQTNADGFLLKPFETQELLELIRSTCNEDQQCSNSQILINVESGMEELFDDFLCAKKRDIQTMKAATGNPVDFEILTLLAHRLKGTAKSYGLDDTLAIKLETAARNKLTKECVELVADLEKYLYRVQRA